MYTLYRRVMASSRLLVAENDGESLREDAPAQIDPERQHLAKRYARARQWLSFVNLGLSALLLVAILASGLNFSLRRALAGTGGWQPIAGFSPVPVALYFLGLYLTIYVISLPASYYSGFILARRYGQSTQSQWSYAKDTAISLALSLVFELAAVLFIYALLTVAPGTWWLWAGLALLLVTALLANLAPILLLPLFYKLTPLLEGGVRERALALAAQSGTQVRGIYSMNMSSKTTAANAMVIGLGNTRRIVLGDTLLDRYSEDEIAFVVAHELGHQVHFDIPKLILVETLTTLGGLALVNLALHAIVGTVTLYHGLSDPATMPLIAVALMIFALVSLPITNGFSRLVEHQADVYALESTRDPGAFISAMTRLANQNLAELEPPGVIEFMLYNHPSIGRRLAYARANQTRFHP